MLDFYCQNTHKKIREKRLSLLCAVNTLFAWWFRHSVQGIPEEKKCLFHKPQGNFINFVFEITITLYHSVGAYSGLHIFFFRKRALRFLLRISIFHLLFFKIKICARKTTVSDYWRIPENDLQWVLNTDFLFLKGLLPRNRYSERKAILLA